MAITLSSEGNAGHDTLSEIRKIHDVFQLRNGHIDPLENFPDGLLSYLIAILKDSEPVLPDISMSEWVRFAVFLHTHGIAPLVYKNIYSLPAELQPPENIVNVLRMDFLKSRISSDQAGRQTGQILDAFNYEEIDLLLLKGPAYARSIYSDTALRASGDIDILVRPENVIRSREIMESLGYACVEKRFEVSKNGYCEEIFCHDDLSRYRPVEVHWNLYTFNMVSKNVDVGQLFDNAVNVNSQGLSFKTLCPIDALIHAVNHLVYSHGHSIRLNWIYDIRLLCEQITGNDDWAAVQELSVKCGARLAMEKALTMTHLWTGLNIPPEFIDLSKWPEPSDDECKAFSYAAKGGTVEKIRLIVPENASVMEKTRLYYRMIFPSNGLVKITDPTFDDRPSYVSHFKRWRRLIRKI
ncbi:hypothetical protein CUJ83_07780 [Methanocella sp. CWC-04]|uniref:Nucleotidyltransferase n=1 Tax=Methanooceanicella nereidis TaxID=2052831 RepID=A0AAP2RF14_9EURY|nr:nucleotidyltransferase family protein [Methanocella sp. CWC-04]MCD1294895.1 hypothetical protein [Methanocella sp. CWC-04]